MATMNLASVVNTPLAHGGDITDIMVLSGAMCVTNLKKNTTPALANKFDASAPALQQILSPLQWTSTASPITAKVMEHQGSVYKVNVFLNVTSTNAQTPQGGQTTVTYNVVLDSSLDWKVTDVGGMDGALPVK